jgi:hypothetical protein
MGLLSPTIDTSTIRTWLAGLQDMTPDMLANGLKKARDFTGFMNLPAFREICRFQPEDFGIPNVRQAFDLIYKTQFGKAGDLGHPVVYHAMRECGVWDLKNLGEQEAYRKFEYHYDAMSKRYMAGEKLDIPVVQAIPEKVERERTPQEMEELKKRNIEAMEKLKELFK